MIGGVAKRYASALFQIAKEKNQVKQFEEELRIVKQVFIENQKLLQILEHPKVLLENKKSLVNEAFSSLSAEIINTLLLLIDRHRIRLVSELVDNFVELANEEQQTAEATVYSVRPLKDEEKQALSEVFAQKVGKKSLKITNVIDQNLIGGLKLQIGNRIFDGSIKSKLERIGRNLAKSS
ncbi:F0F1 ATP synthase subunit delta [Aeribacillus composti]|uniref:F0F1 ATP synthase subunit delta n=1 Tax=Aeribacillus composti TaxID=1868734 RepID=UPI002E1F4DC3|nr:F0F1 ATP synthase subunit delta [Aeribacillus composti]MED0746036.1 F0F1 ATP synthase subunit delta [Aeribacillus composti]